ncbi:MAG: peptidase [Nitrosopumilus sp.]|nr:MAG: peptidase [Nitrosopumilus sp.]
MTILLGTLMMPSAFAQFQSGGVDMPGTWYVGEGLKHGDYFSYNLCHVDYKECAEFGMDLWIKGDIESGSETKWLAEVVVYDGNKIVVGEMEMGKIAPEPTGGSPELGVYRGAFKSSVAWLSAFATSDAGTSGKGPKAFSATSWGKIGNIGGEQVRPMKIETITISSGTWDTVQMGWRTGGQTSKVWIVDEFPFPVKAHTLTHVSEGIPPAEYKFELLDYKENVTTSPFSGIESTADTFAAQGCDTDFERDIAVKKPTNHFDYQIHVFYGPEEPVQGCEMQWLIKFISKFDDTEFLNQVQFDFLVVDENLTPLRSMAQEEGRQYLYSPSGQYILDMVVKEPAGEANYVIWVYGLAPEGIVPSTSSDYLKVPVTVFAGEEGTPIIAPPVDKTPEKIPEWIKNNAGWWAEGAIDDGSFVQGIQFLIKEGIMQIPPTAQGTGSSNEIPSWVKQNAAWWAEGAIDDNSFVQGIQFLIKEGIMSITS